MIGFERVGQIALAASMLPLALVACMAGRSPGVVTAATTPLPATIRPEALGPVVGMRRLSESQYRNAIADIFGPGIKVAGRFEPIVRPAHQLLAVGAGVSTISPAGLEQFDALGRSIAAQVFDEANRATFMPCSPIDPAKADAECAKQALAPLGRYLFRRPLTDGELAGYVAMAGAATGQGGSFHEGLQLALAAMLVSPNFLYVVESAEPDPAKRSEMRLDAFSRASRLSFLLWNTTPGEALLDAAAQGTLDDPAGLEAVATRMIASPRFEAGVRAFFSDMLLFEKFDELAKDAVVYPRFNPAVASALPEQMLRMVVAHLVTKSGDYRELFTTRETFMNRPLGALYKVPVRSRDGWEPYRFGEDEDRAGLLGQAGFLALYSHSGRSSPTLRGRAVRELLLCQPVPNPPGNVNFTAVQDVHNRTMPTARDRLTAHNTDPVCAACHRITDPIGLPLERFDGIGAFRARENEAAIDVSGSFEGASFTGAAGLGKALAASPGTTQCLATRSLEFATGRPAENEALTTDLDKRFAADGYRIASLFLRVATMAEAYRVPRAAPDPKRIATSPAAGLPTGGAR